MAWEQIATGDNSNLNDIIGYEENQVAEGQRARLECECIGPVPSSQITALRNSLSWAGVEDLEITSSGSTVNIYWRKGFPWAAVIILALVAIIVITLWRMFKDVPIPVKSAVLIGCAILGVAIAIGIIRNKSPGIKS